MYEEIIQDLEQKNTALQQDIDTATDKLNQYYSLMNDEQTKIDEATKKIENNTAAISVLNGYNLP